MLRTGFERRTLSVGRGGPRLSGSEQCFTVCAAEENVTKRNFERGTASVGLGGPGWTRPRAMDGAPIEAVPLSKFRLRHRRRSSWIVPTFKLRSVNVLSFR